MTRVASNMSMLGGGRRGGGGSPFGGPPGGAGGVPPGAAGRGGPPARGGSPNISFGGAPPKPSANAPTGQGSVINVTEREFEREVLMSELPVLIEFSAEWCAPCKQIAPEVEAVARELAGKAKVVKIDIDKSQVIARQLRIQSVPTFMVFAEQRIVDAQVGAIRKKQMLAMLDPYLPRAEGAIKPREVAELLKVGAVTAVDTRDAASFKRVHLPGAVHMALEEIEGRLAELHMVAEHPLLYCRTGEQSKDLASRLADQGVPVAYLEGGLLAWEGEALPIERG